MQTMGLVSGIETLQQRAQLAIYGAYAVMGVFALALVGEVLELAGVIDLANAVDDPLAALFAVILLLTTVVFLGSVVVVAMWIHRAHANLHEAGLPGLQNSPGWAVGWYFIPIANLFKPYQAMRELWSESHQSRDSYASAAPGNLGLWWGLWIVGNILGNISTRLSMMGDPSAYQISIVIGIASSICTIGSAWQLIQIIRAVTAAQSDGIAASAIFE